MEQMLIGLPLGSKIIIFFFFLILKNLTEVLHCFEMKLKTENKTNKQKNTEKH